MAIVLTAGGRSSLYLKVKSCACSSTKKLLRGVHIFTSEACNILQVVCSQNVEGLQWRLDMLDLAETCNKLANSNMKMIKVLFVCCYDVVVILTSSPARLTS
jgi:hypothetical protein